MSFTFLYLAIGLAALTWLAVARGWKTVEYTAKPGTILALLAWLWSVNGFSGQMAWFALGLFFSLWGDVFLMLPKEQLIAGLVAFVLAHLAYLIGFNASLPPANLPAILLSVMVGLTAARVYRGIARGLLQSGRTRLQPLVLAYSSMLSLMVLSALLTLVRPEWAAGTSFLASGGALLFFLSDSILAWSKFVTPIPNGRLLLMITYHLGQVFIILGSALQFLP